MTPFIGILVVVFVALLTLAAISGPYSKLRKVLVSVLADGLYTLFIYVSHLFVVSLGALLLAYPVLLVWNETMVDQFGVKTLSYWPSWGLCFLLLLLVRGAGSSGNSD